jgi:hypothetical protein
MNEDLGTSLVGGVQNMSPDYQRYLAWLRAQQGQLAQPNLTGRVDLTPIAAPAPELPQPSPPGAEFDLGAKLASTVYDPKTAPSTLRVPELRAGNELPSAAYETDVRRTIASGAQAAGVPQARAEQIGSGGAGTVANLAAQVGPVGTVLSAQDVPHHLGEVVTRARAGDIEGAAGAAGEAALAGVGAIPGARGVKLGAKAAREARAAKAAGRTGRGLPYRSTDDLPPKSHNMPPEELPTERTPSSGYGPESRASVEQMASEGPVPEPKVKVPETLTEAVVDAGKNYREKVTAKTAKEAAEIKSGLRELSTEDAIQVVRGNPHLQQREADGSFVGAPKQIKTEQHVAEVRKRMDESIALGAGIGGDKWYPRGRETVSELTRGDPEGGRLMAGSLGVTSAQATPETNLQFELAAHNKYLMGEPAKIAHTGATAENLNKARDLGTDTKMGPKTFVYQQNLDPSAPFSTTGVNDIWMARMMEYFQPDGKPWDKALSAKQHAWMDHETIAAVDRANQMKLGGRDNWQAHEIQAAGWVGRKAQSEAAKKGIPIEQALKEARIEYDDFVNKHTAYGTYDELPGRMTGHGTHLLGDKPEEKAARKAFLEDPRSTWTNKTGHDVIYSSFGEEPRLKPRERRSVPTTSVYTSGEPGAPTEISTGGAARPLMSLAGPSGAKQMDPQSRKMMELGETFRAAMGTQEMGAGSMMFPTNKPGLQRSVAFKTGAPTEQQVLAAKGIGAKYGVPDFVHYGEDRGGLLTRFGDNDRPGAANATALGKAVEGRRGVPGPMAQELEQLFQGAQPQRTDVQAVTAWLGDDWAAGEGSGKVTNKLLEVFSNPLHRSWVDNSPELRENIAARVQRDIEHIKNVGAPYRQDAENLMSTFAQGGLELVEKELKAGRLAFPVVVGIMGPALYQMFGGGEAGQAQASPGPGS